MTYTINLFAHTAHLSSFNIKSNDLPITVLNELKRQIERNWIPKCTYFNGLIKQDDNFLLKEIKWMCLTPKVSQNTLIICSIIKHYIVNNKQPFKTSITCNDFKLEVNIDLSKLKKSPTLFC